MSTVIKKENNKGKKCFNGLPGPRGVSGSLISKMMLCVISLTPCMVLSLKQSTSTLCKTLPLPLKYKINKNRYAIF